MVSNDAERVFRERAEAFNTFRFHWEIKDKVAGSAMPGRSGNISNDLEILKKNRINLVINLTTKTLKIPPEFEKIFEVINLPIIDGHPPSNEQLDEIIRIVRNAAAEGKRSVIHCRGGIGRTATVLVPLIMDLENLSLEEAFIKVRRSGRFTQTREQREFLESWARNKC